MRMQIEIGGRERLAFDYVKYTSKLTLYTADDGIDKISLHIHANMI